MFSDHFTGHALKPQVSSIFTSFLDGLKKFYITKVMNHLKRASPFFLFSFFHEKNWPTSSIHSSKGSTRTTCVWPRYCLRETVRRSCSTRSKYMTSLQSLGTEFFYHLCVRKCQSTIHCSFEHYCGGGGLRSMSLYLTSHYNVAVKRMEKHRYTLQTWPSTHYFVSLWIDGSPVDVLLSGWLSW